MKRRVFQVLGKATAVSHVDEMGTMTVLLGKPRRASQAEPYQMARRILDNAAGNVRIVEESDSDAFVDDLERTMRAHGLIQ